MPFNTQHFFADDGPLAHAISNYEPRAEQQTLAAGIAEALERSRTLLAEAGTGTGKSLAYLAPAVQSGHCVIVSTATKTLQEQLLTQDIPILERALQRPIAAMILKGRSNYLCLLRAEQVLAEQSLFPDSGYALRAQIKAWSQHTTTGDRAELSELGDDDPLWASVSTTQEQCLGRRCKDFDRCFVTQARRQAQQAQILIVNHHLYFAEKALQAQQQEHAPVLLPTHHTVIFDEAHEVEDTAAQHFGSQVSERQIHELVRDIQLATHGDVSLSRTLAPMLGEVALRAKQLFAVLPGKVGRYLLEPESLRRYPDVHRHHHRLDTLLRELANDLGRLDSPEVDNLCYRLLTTREALSTVLPMTTGEASESAPSATESWVQYDAEEIHQRQQAAKASSNPFVHYLEISPRGQRSLVARPVDVSSSLRQALQDQPAIFLSATLRVSESFEHARAQLGLNDADEVAVDSPFDFAKQCRLFIPKALPAPGHDDYLAQVTPMVGELLRASNGGAFLLCTSHRMVSVFSQKLRGRHPNPVLVQGQAPRTALLQRFREHGDAILIATLSFWRGVDVPGSALRLVVMDKLPFSAPDDPVAHAKIEFLKRQGQDSFRQFQMPQAALLLRQGFGRLIRRTSDAGLVAVLDSRLLTHSYGKFFLRSLPACPILHDLDSAVAYLAARPEDTD